MSDFTEYTVFIILFLMVLIYLPSFIKSRSLFAKHELFECSLCGNCCRFRITPVTELDIKRLQDGGFRDFLSENSTRLKRVNGRCIFLKDDKCGAHNVRPRVCRDFPFFKTLGIGYAQSASFCPALERLDNG